MKVCLCFEWTLSIWQIFFWQVFWPKIWLIVNKSKVNTKNRYFSFPHIFSLISQLKSKVTMNGRSPPCRHLVPLRKSSMPFSLYSAAWASFRPVESQEQDTFKEGGVVFATEEAGHLSEKIIVAYRLIWRKIDDVVLKRPKTSRPSFWRKIELLRLNLQTCFDSFVAKFSRLKPFLAFLETFVCRK